MKRLILLSIATLVLSGVFNSSVSQAGDIPTVSDLSWMTGSWAGPIGTATLEETWNQARDGSIAALVRMTSEGATIMMELIVIEEEDDSLVLRIQQWNPGFVSRTEGPQKLHLASIADNTVSFKSKDNSKIRNLVYARTPSNTFTIKVDLDDGTVFDLELDRQ